MKIYGLSGTNGAGKDTVGDALAEQGWLFVSVSDMLRVEAKKRNLPVERETLRTISAEWRRELGLGALIDKSVDYYKVQDKSYKGLVMSSLRNPGEADRVHELGGQVIWVDADPKVRYQRIYSRQRTAEDNKTFEQFLDEQEQEMKQSGDEATLNIAGVKAKSDICLENNGNDIQAFMAEAAKKLSIA